VIPKQFEHMRGVGKDPDLLRSFWMIEIWLFMSIRRILEEIFFSIEVS
jgi:hypothetical protein